RNLALELRHSLAESVDHGDRVGARLLDDREDDDGFAVERSRALGVLLGVAHLGDVADPDHAVLADGDRDVPEVRRVADAALDAKLERLRAALDVAAGKLDVLGGERPLDVHRGQPEALEPDGIDRDVDLALSAAEDAHPADAVERLDAREDPLIGVLGHLPRGAGGDHGDLQDRRFVGIDLLDLGRVDALRQVSHDSVDPVADLLGRDVDVFVEVEASDDDREALVRVAPELVETADRVERLLDRLAELGLHLLGRGARQDGADDDDREVDVREAVDPEAEEAGASEDQ